MVFYHVYSWCRLWLLRDQERQGPNLGKGESASYSNFTPKILCTHICSFFLLLLFSIWCCQRDILAIIHWCFYRIFVVVVAADADFPFCYGNHRCQFDEESIQVSSICNPLINKRKKKKSVDIFSWHGHGRTSERKSEGVTVEFHFWSLDIHTLPIFKIILWANSL